MKPLKYLFVSSLFLIISSSVGLHSQAGSRSIRWKIKLQPYQGAVISVDGVKLKKRLVARDKTLGTFILKLKLPAGRDSVLLKIEKAGYRSLERKISRNQLKRKSVFVLDKAGSRFRYYGYFRTGREPKSVTFIDNERVSLPLLADGGIDIINVRTGKTRRIKPPRKYARIGGFVETAVLEDAGEFWVSQMFNSHVHIFNRKTLAYKSTIRTRGRLNKVLLHDSARGLVYQTNWLGRNITVLDANKKKELYSFSAGGTPRGLVLSPDGRYLFVAQFGGQSADDGKGRVVKVSLKTKRIIKRYAGSGAGAKRHIVYSKKLNRLFVSDLRRARVEALDADTGKLLGVTKVFSKPNSIKLTPDGKYLFVSCRGPNNPVKGYRFKGYHMGRIYVLNPATMEVVEQWEGGNQPTGLDISPDGKFMVFSDFLDRAIRVYKIK